MDRVMVPEKMAGKIINFYRGKIQIFIRVKIYILNVLKITHIHNLRIIRFNLSQNEVQSRIEKISGNRSIDTCPHSF